MYLAHIKTIVKEQFESGKYKSRAQQIQSNIDYYVKSDENKLYDYGLFKKNIEESVPVGKQNIIGIAELMSGRTEKIMGHPLMTKDDPKVSMVNHRSNSDSTILVQARVEDLENVYLFYKENTIGITEKVLMNDKGENGDTQPDDKTYSVELPKDKLKYYYIVAEGEKTATVHPSNGSFAMLKVQ